VRLARERGHGRLRCALAALACGCALLAFARGAAAQVSGTVGVVSDYRYRGYSLSDGDPAVQASVAYDWTQGPYAGVFASSVDGGAQFIPYLGFARRDAQGRNWDIGARWSRFTAGDGIDYVEFHAGVAIRRIALRVHYAPDYYGQVSNWYVEADGSIPVGERVRVLLHAGLARSGEDIDGGEAPPGYGGGGGIGYPPSYARPQRQATYGTRDSDRTRIDVRAGLAFTTRACDVQLSWQHIDGTNDVPYSAPWNPNDRSGWVLGCVHRW